MIKRLCGARARVGDYLLKWCFKCLLSERLMTQKNREQMSILFDMSCLLVFAVLQSV